MTRPIHEIARAVLTYARSWEPAAKLLGNVMAAEVERLAETVSDSGNVTQARAILEGLQRDIEAAAAFQQRAGGQQVSPPVLTLMPPGARIHVSRAIRHALGALEEAPTTDRERLWEALRRAYDRGALGVRDPVTVDPVSRAESIDRILADLLTSSPWRPIEECGELEEGEVYLVLVDNGRGSQWPEVDTWRPGGYWAHEPRRVTHVHSMGPIRGVGASHE